MLFPDKLIILETAPDSAFCGRQCCPSGNDGNQPGEAGLFGLIQVRGVSRIRMGGTAFSCQNPLLWNQLPAWDLPQGLSLNIPPFS